MAGVTDLDLIRGLEPEWRRLAVRRGNAFLTPEWFRCWFEHYGDAATPFVPVLRDGNGALRGLLPLALLRSGHPRVCRIAGANLGDRFHPVCEPDDEAEVAAAAGQALAEAPEPWSIVALDHVQLDPAWVEALAESTGARLRTLQRTAAPLPLIELSAHASWDDYLASRSSKLRHQVRHHARRAARGHSLRLRRTERPDELASDFATFLDLHYRRLGTHGGSSLVSERARAFHVAFAAAALERGWLRLWFLELDDRPAAAWYGWRLGDRYAFYNTGFDPVFSALSPGFVLLSAVIESAFEEGAAEFDFLLGAESYKYRFAERDRTVSDVTLARAFPHPASLLASAEYGARRMGRLIPASARRRLGRLARRSSMRGRGG